MAIIVYEVIVINKISDFKSFTNYFNYVMNLSESDSDLFLNDIKKEASKVSQLNDAEMIDIYSIDIRKAKIDCLREMDEAVNEINSELLKFSDASFLYNKYDKSTMTSLLLSMKFSDYISIMIDYNDIEHLVEKLFKSILSIGNINSEQKINFLKEQFKSIDFLKSKYTDIDVFFERKFKAELRKAIIYNFSDSMCISITGKGKIFAAQEGLRDLRNDYSKYKEMLSSELDEFRLISEQVQSFNSNLLQIISILVAAFAIIGVNIGTIPKITTGEDIAGQCINVMSIIAINLSLAAVLGFMFYLVGVINDKEKVYKLIYAHLRNLVIITLFLFLVLAIITMNQLGMI